MASGRGGGGGHEELDVVDRGAEVGVFLGDGFALFGHAKEAAEGTLGEGFHEPVGGAGAAAHGAAAAVEEDGADAVVLTGGGEVGLGAVEGPLAREDAAVFIAIGVADHHLEGRAVWGEAALGDGVGEEIVGDGGGRGEVAHGFKRGATGRGQRRPWGVHSMRPASRASK